MKKMRALMVMLLAVMLLMSSLAGCSSAPSNSSRTSNDGKNANATSDKFITIMVEGGSPGEAVAKATAEDFKKLTGYDVVVDAVPYSGIYDKINAEIKSGKATHDVATLDVLWLPGLQSGLLPLNDIVTDEVKNDSMPKLVESATINNNLLGYPMWTNCKILIYCKDLFENEANKTAFKNQFGYDLKPPTTWKEYNDTAKFFTKDGMYGTSVFGANNGDTVCSWLDHVTQAGGNPLVLDKDNNVLIDQQPYVDAMQFIVDLYKNGYAPKETLSVASGESQELFKNGKIAMQLAWGHQYADAVKGLGADKVGVAPMIGGSAGIGAVIGPWYESILKNSTKTDIAKKYLQFMFDNNKAYMEASLKIAGRKSVIEKYSKQLGFENQQAMLTTMDSKQTQNRPATPHWNEIEAIFATTVQDCLNGSDIKQELAKAKKSIEEIVKE